MALTPATGQEISIGCVYTAFGLIPIPGSNIGLNSTLGVNRQPPQAAGVTAIAASTVTTLSSDMGGLDTPQNYCKLTFGGGNNSADDMLRDFAANGVVLDLSKYQNNFGLGSTLKPNSTLFIQYRIGGGAGSNLGVNVINQIGTINFFVNGPSQIISSNVINSFLLCFYLLLSNFTTVGAIVYNECNNNYICLN